VSRNTLLTAALAAAVALAAAAPSLAATAPKVPHKAYFVEQSVRSNACYVVAFKPNPKFAREVGSASYGSFWKAVAALKADPSCRPAHHMVMKIKAKATSKTPPKPKA
jgi:hypothetical protein